MVNLENQGVMTEFDAVHGISTSELFLITHSLLLFYVTM